MGYPQFLIDPCQRAQRFTSAIPESAHAFFISINDVQLQGL